MTIHQIPSRDQLEKFMRLVRQGKITGEHVDAFTEQPDRCLMWLPLDPLVYARPLTESEIPEKHQDTLAKYRGLWKLSPHQHGWSQYEYSLPLCYRIRWGFTLRHHAPRITEYAFRCFKNFAPEVEKDFVDEPTEGCLVFWVPTLLDNSFDRTIDEQKQLLNELRQELKMPRGHLQKFGSGALLALLSSAYRVATGQDVPSLMLGWARTDTRCVGGDQVGIGGFEIPRPEEGGYEGFDGSYYPGNRGHECIGIFPIGFEPLGD